MKTLNYLHLQTENILKGELVVRDLKQNKAIVKAKNIYGKTGGSPEYYYVALIRMPKSRNPKRRRWFNVCIYHTKKLAMDWFKREKK